MGLRKATQVLPGPQVVKTRGGAGGAHEAAKLRVGGHSMLGE